jgi:hypothetical protein
VVFGAGVPAHAVRDENHEGGNSGVEGENLIPGQGPVGLNAFNEIKSEKPTPGSLGAFARPSQLSEHSISDHHTTPHDSIQHGVVTAIGIISQEEVNEATVTTFTWQRPSN